MRNVTLDDGKVDKTLVAECKLCKSGHTQEKYDIPALLYDFEHLSEEDRSVILTWMSKGRRGRVDRIWRQYRRLPEALRVDVRRQFTPKKT